MGFPCGNFVPGNFEIVMDSGNTANAERMIQHQLQRRNGITLALVGSLHHDTHIPPVLSGRIVETHIPDPRAVGTALDVCMETLRPLSDHVFIPTGQYLVRVVDTAGVPM